VNYVFKDKRYVAKFREKNNLNIKSQVLSHNWTCL